MCPAAIVFGMHSVSPKIKILSEELCNKIAAGEVVERPSSVVKELIENSLDAQAGRILVELECGGKRLIRVTDDGCGMSRQDALLSFERHATSKISTDADLFALLTLGFRGEALASIASVSRLKLSTCDNLQGEGQDILAEGGRIKKVQELGLPKGTRVEVRHLFFNLPARKKFLRKDQTELGHAADVVSKLALAHPEVAFSLIHDGRTLLELPREKGLSQRVAALLGRSLLRDLLPLENCTADGLQLKGLISQPQLNRSAATHIYTFINGRYIRDRVVQHAVMEGYRQLLMKGRYPVVVLFIHMDPARVDVNVHPTKHEVRFRDQGQVHDFIAATIKRTLSPGVWPDKERPLAAALPVESSFAAGEAKTGIQQPVETSAWSDTASTDGGYVHASASSPLPRASHRVAATTEAGTEFMVAETASPSLFPISGPDGFFSRLKILGQYHQSYLLCQDGDDLILIDQHAAHERVGFEGLKKAYRQGKIAMQMLMFPEVLELDYRSASALQDNIEQLRHLGFEIEPFGGNAFALKAAPQLLGQRALARLVVDVALELERIGRTGQLDDAIDDVLILMACHTVVRANQALTAEEIRALFKAMDQIDCKANCPHGRPVMQRLTLGEIEKLFKR